MVDLALALKERGYDVSVACSAGGPLAARLEEADIPVPVLLGVVAKRRVGFRLAWRLRRLLVRGRFDLVHAHIYASAVAAALATFATRVPLVITEHSEGRWRTRRSWWVTRWAYARAAHVITVSAPIRRLLLERAGLRPERVSVIPNALPQPERPGETATPPFASPLVGVVARLQPEKGLTVFLEAASRVASAVPDVEFLVVGDGPLRGALPALADSLGLNGRVHFLGARADADALIERLDVLVVPSLSEGSPLVVLEAMHAGVPVVATAVGGIPEQIRNAREGLLVPPGDATALADAVRDLLREPERARALAAEARRRAAEAFAHERVVDEIERRYVGAIRALRDAASPPTYPPGTPVRG